MHLSSTRAYRSTHHQPAITAATEDSNYPSLTTSKWTFFWKSHISPVACTIWWRALHGKLSCRTNLHHILPARFDRPLCVLGDLALDTGNHFLFSCPYKWHIWQQVLQDCTLSTITQATIFDALFNLSMPSWNLSHSPLSPMQLIAGVLVGVWKAHWLHVFSAAPFLSTNIIDSTHKLLINFR